MSGYLLTKLPQIHSTHCTTCIGQASKCHSSPVLSPSCTLQFPGELFFLKKKNKLDSWILPLKCSNLIVPDWVQASRFKKYLPGELNEHQLEKYVHSRFFLKIIKQYKYVQFDFVKFMISYLYIYLYFVLLNVFIV